MWQLITFTDEANKSLTYEYDEDPLSLIRKQRQGDTAVLVAFFPMVKKY